METLHSPDAHLRPLLSLPLGFPTQRKSKNSRICICFCMMCRFPCFPSPHNVVSFCRSLGQKSKTETRMQLGKLGTGNDGIASMYLQDPNDYENRGQRPEEDQITKMCRLSASGAKIWDAVGIFGTPISRLRTTNATWPHFADLGVGKKVKVKHGAGKLGPEGKLMSKSTLDEQGNDGQEHASDWHATCMQLARSCSCTEFESFPFPPAMDLGLRILGAGLRSRGIGDWGFWTRADIHYMP